MRYTTTVKLVLAESPDSPVSFVKIALFDRDRITPDDMLGSSRTDEQGEARIEFTTDQFEDVDEKLGGDMPELYAVVYDYRDQVVWTTRDAAEINFARKQITIPIPVQLALRHRLVPAD